MATKATTIFSLNKVKTYLGIEGATHDAMLEVLADGVSERIEAYLGRAFVTRSVTETLDGNGKQFIFLRNYPVQSVTSLRIRYSLLDEWTELTVAAETVLDQRLGRLYLTSTCFPKGPLAVEVTYQAGFGAQDNAALPADVVQAALDYLKFVYDRKTSGATVAASMTIGPNTISVVPDIPADVKRALDAYKKFRAVMR
jgi:uncharacterized phiE125 gp8 family phage protein